MGLSIMQDYTDNVTCFDKAFLTKCIFKGMTLSAIAREMNVATSTVSYYVGQLYSGYGVKTRNDFVVKVLGQIIQNYKQVISVKNTKIVELENKTDEILSILKGISTSAKNPIVLDYWISESKKFI